MRARWCADAGHGADQGAGQLAAQMVEAAQDRRETGLRKRPAPARAEEQHRPWAIGTLLLHIVVI